MEVFYIDLEEKKHCVWFKKISTPSPWKVIGNSEGVEGLKSQLKESMKLNNFGIFRGVESKPKNLQWEGYGYFLEEDINE